MGATNRPQEIDEAVLRYCKLLFIAEKDFQLYKQLISIISPITVSVSEPGISFWSSCKFKKDF
jgi:hypothetical protein